MAQTQAHGRKVFRVQPIQKRGKLTPNAAEQVHRLICDDIDPELFADRVSCKTGVHMPCREAQNIHDAPSFASNTVRASFPFPLPTISSDKNFFRPFPSLPSWSAVISSTAVAVDVKRWRDLSFSLHFEATRVKGTQEESSSSLSDITLLQSAL